MMPERILPPAYNGSQQEQGPSNPIYYDLAQREYRGYRLVDEDGIERKGLAKNKDKVRMLDDMEGDVVIPISRYGYPMSPVETSTGIPLPIISSTTSRGGKGGHDLHHAFFYDNLYATTLEHRAVRYSRLQRVPQWAHTRYHQHFDGTAHPEDEHEAFKVTILNLAGYVPEYGVYAKKKEMIIRPLRSSERQALRQPESFVAEKYERGSGIQRKSIGQFIMYYALSQNFDVVRQREVEEFLSITPDVIESAPHSHQHRLQGRKRQLAMRLTNVALDASVDPVRPDFRRAQNQSLLRRDLSAKDPWWIAKAQLRDKEPDYYETLEGLLSAKFGAAA